MSIETELARYQQQMEAGWEETKTKLPDHALTKVEGELYQMVFNLGFMRGVAYEREVYREPETTTGTE